LSFNALLFFYGFQAHTLFITAKGQVYAAGENKFGAVGPGCPKKKDTATEPVLVPGVTGAVRCAAGDSFSMVVTSSGALFSFGWSEFGQLG
jgi:alpha-tubulin suppressor-like RCC1 family protein